MSICLRFMSHLCFLNLNYCHKWWVVSVRKCKQLFVYNVSVKELTQAGPVSEWMSRLALDLLSLRLSTTLSPPPLPLPSPFLAFPFPSPFFPFLYSVCFPCLIVVVICYLLYQSLFLVFFLKRRKNWNVCSLKCSKHLTFSVKNLLFDLVLSVCNIASIFQPRQIPDFFNAKCSLKVWWSLLPLR